MFLAGAASRQPAMRGDAMATRLNRRQFLATSLAAAAIGARDVSFPAIVHAQEPIRIGQLIPFTGFLGAIGEGCNTQYVSAIGNWLIKERKISRWYFLTSDYAFGHDLLRVARGLLAANKGTEVGSALAPTGTTDFSQYITKMKAAKPDLIFHNLAGADVTNFLKQYAEAGMTIEVAGGVIDSAYAWPVGEALRGHFPIIWWHELSTPASVAWAARYIKRWGRPPDNQAYGDYIAVHAIAQAIDKAKSTDSARLVAALEGHTLAGTTDGLKGRPLTFRAWDHQLLQPMYVVGAKGKSKWKDKWDIFVVIEATLLRRLYLEGPLQGLLLTFGLAMVFEQGIRLLWGLSPKQFDVPAALAGALALGSLTYSRYRSFILVCAVVLIVGLALFLQKTAIGTIVRAGSRDPMMVRLLGISLTPVLTLVFGLGVALAALAGVLSAPLAGVQPAMGVNVGTAAFVVVTIGGRRDPPRPLRARQAVGEGG